MPDSKPFPAHPNLEQYKKQAKDLLKAYRVADVETIGRVKAQSIRVLKGFLSPGLRSANSRWPMPSW